MDWKLAYAKNSVAKDLELNTIKKIKKSRFDIIPATVPGHFQMDYINAGKMPGINSKDDLYFGGVNLGFETHGNVDATFEIRNFNLASYN